MSESFFGGLAFQWEMVGTLPGLLYFEYIKAAAEDDHADRLA